MNLEYRYSPTQNNGQATQMKNWITGEEVNYSYDSLNRLRAASTTGSHWGLSWTYDGFGNRTNQAITKGQAYASATPVNAATNRLTGGVYDASGNVTSSSGLTLVYDIKNRIVEATKQGAGTERYAYTPSNQRVYKEVGGGRFAYFYSPEGQRMATYEVSSCPQETRLCFRQVNTRLYFAGRPVELTDRVGSSGSYFGAMYFGAVGAVVGAATTALISPWAKPLANDILKKINHAVAESAGRAYHEDCDRQFSVW